MERRLSKRVNVKLGAELVSGDRTYAGVIENLSEHGIFMRTVPWETPVNCLPGTTIVLKFQPSSGETLSLHCEVKWLHIDKTPSLGLTNSMGMAIIDPPRQYKEFLRPLV